MALLLGDHVVAGEIINRRGYMTHGWLALRGDETPVIFQLTGNCSPDMRGKHLRFSIPDERPPPRNPSPLDVKQLARQQIGPTGQITLTTPTGGKPRLFMEWHSQNGHVVLDLIDPEFEWVAEDDEDRRRAAADSAAATVEDGDIYMPDTDADVGDTFNPFEVPPPDAEEDADDPYGLFPPGLDDELSDHGDEVTTAAAEEPPSGDAPAKRSWDEVIPGIDEETKRMYEEWDEVTEGTKDVPFREAFDPPITIYTPDQFDTLPEADAEKALKELLARLALLGVAVAVCDHFSIQLAFRMIAEEILPKYGVHPRLPQIGWVQHYDTSEFCRKCEERFEREYQERRSKEEQEDEDSSPGSDAQPL
jgi:hypothetical protein